MGPQREITLSGFARRGTGAALNLLFPPLCVACRARVGEPHSLCAKCWSAISFIEGAACALCGAPFDVDPGGETICGPCHAKPHDFAKARALLTEADLIVPVPLHRWRLWRRRYNQAAILSTRLAKLAARPHDPLALERKRPTKSQGEMPSAKARRRNVLGAFRVPPAKVSQVKGRNILLVDDVFTTGATLDACARALKRAGAARVDALTLARVVRERSSDI